MLIISVKFYQILPEFVPQIWATDMQNSFQTFFTEVLIVLGFNDRSTLVGHFVLSLKQREKRYRRGEKRDRRDSRGDEREG